MADVAVAWIGVAGAAVGALAGVVSGWATSVWQARQRYQEWAHERTVAERARKADLYFDVQRAAHHYYRLLRQACRYRLGQGPEIAESVVRDAERELRQLSYWTDLYAPPDLAELIKSIGGWTSERFRMIGYNTEREMGAANPSTDAILMVVDEGIAELRRKREEMVGLMRVDLRPDDSSKR